MCFETIQDGPEAWKLRIYSNARGPGVMEARGPVYVQRSGGGREDTSSGGANISGFGAGENLLEGENQFWDETEIDSRTGEKRSEDHKTSPPQSIEIPKTKGPVDQSSQSLERPVEHC